MFHVRHDFASSQLPNCEQRHFRSKVQGHRIYHICGTHLWQKALHSVILSRGNKLSHYFRSSSTSNTKRPSNNQQINFNRFFIQQPTHTRPFPLRQFTVTMFTASRLPSATKTEPKKNGTKLHSHHEDRWFLVASAVSVVAQKLFSSVLSASLFLSVAPCMNKTIINQVSAIEIDSIYRVNTKVCVRVFFLCLSSSIRSFRPTT